MPRRRSRAAARAGRTCARRGSALRASAAAARRPAGCRRCGCACAMTTTRMRTTASATPPAVTRGAAPGARLLAPWAAYRPRRAPGKGSRCAPCGVLSPSSSRAVRHEDVAHAPDRLDVARLRGVGLDHLAQARDLHVEAAIERLELAAARQLRQLVARQRLAGMPHERLEHRELAGRERDLLAVLRQP